MVYKTSGVCSSAISFEIDEQGKVHDVKFQGGCSGNTAFQSSERSFKLNSTAKPENHIGSPVFCIFLY